MSLLSRLFENEAPISPRFLDSIKLLLHRTHPEFVGVTRLKNSDPKHMQLLASLLNYAAKKYNPHLYLYKPHAIRAAIDAGIDGGWRKDERGHDVLHLRAKDGTVTAYHDPEKTIRAVVPHRGAWNLSRKSSFPQEEAPKMLRSLLLHPEEEPSSEPQKSHNISKVVSKLKNLRPSLEQTMPLFDRVISEARKVKSNDTAQERWDRLLSKYKKKPEHEHPLGRVSKIPHGYEVQDDSGEKYHLKYLGPDDDTQDHGWSLHHPEHGAIGGFTVSPKNEITWAKIDDKFKGKGLGKEVYKALAHFHGRLESDPNYTSKEAHNVYRSLTKHGWSRKTGEHTPGGGDTEEDTERWSLGPMNIKRNVKKLRLLNKR